MALEINSIHITIYIYILYYMFAVGYAKWSGTTHQGAGGSG